MTRPEHRSSIRLEPGWHRSTGHAIRGLRPSRRITQLPPRGPLAGTVLVCDGASLLQIGKGHEAIKHLRATVGEHPEVRYLLGLTLFEQGHLNEALVELKAFLDRSAVRGSDVDANARVVAAASLDRLGVGGRRNISCRDCSATGRTMRPRISLSATSTSTRVHSARRSSHIGVT